MSKPAEQPLRRRRRDTPTTVRIKPISMEQIAREFAEAMNQDTKEKP